MKNLLIRFTNLNFWVKMIFCFCLIGVLSNTVLCIRDLMTGGILFRLHAGFWVLYASQAVFILLGERYVSVLALVQGLLAFFTNADFTFVPLLRAVGTVYYVLFPVPTLQMMSAYKYIFISAAFTLQMLSAYVLLVSFPKPAPKKEPVVEK